MIWVASLGLCFTDNGEGVVLRDPQASTGEKCGQTSAQLSALQAEAGLGGSSSFCCTLAPACGASQESRDSLLSASEDDMALPRHR